MKFSACEFVPVLACKVRIVLCGVLVGRHGARWVSYHGGNRGSEKEGERRRMRRGFNSVMVKRDATIPHRWGDKRIGDLFFLGLVLSGVYSPFTLVVDIRSDSNSGGNSLGWLDLTWRDRPTSNSLLAAMVSLSNQRGLDPSYYSYPLFFFTFAQLEFYRVYWTLASLLSYFILWYSALPYFPTIAFFHQLPSSRYLAPASIRLALYYIVPISLHDPSNTTPL